MEQEYLPGDTPQQRLPDLMKEYKITQAELASKIGVAESSISRFLNGTKNKLTIEQIISIARIFNVSSDFLLCLTNVPDKKNYDISELGLSAEAARNLYTGRVNPEVVSRLLENRRFAQPTSMIALYFDETMASGFAAQNQILQSLSSMLLMTGKEQPDVRKASQQAAQAVSGFSSRSEQYSESIHGRSSRDQKGNDFWGGDFPEHDKRAYRADVLRTDQRAGSSSSISFPRAACSHGRAAHIPDGTGRR